MAYSSLIQQSDPSIFLDLGFGRTPRTTLESAERFRLLNPGLTVVGVEIDRERVRAAQRSASSVTHFLYGGFETTFSHPARLIRAMNVLRQYPEEAVQDAWIAMGRNLTEGGILLEGTSDPFGRRMAVNVLQRQDSVLYLVGLLFCAGFGEPFDPDDFPPVLPKNFIHRMIPREPIFSFMTAWRAAWQQALPYRAFGPRVLFRESAKILEERCLLDRRRGLQRRGYLWWLSRPETDVTSEPATMACPRLALRL